MRSLLRNPLVSGLTVATIALVICGVTLIASFIVGTLIDAGPYRRPARVLGFQFIAPSLPYPRIYFPYDDYVSLRAASTGANGVFDEVTALGVAYVMMTGSGEPAHLNAGVMPARTFARLGVPPLLGRTLGDEDDRTGAAPVIVLSEEVWRQSFGADRGIIGRIVRIDGQPHEIVGVMPARFTWGVLTAWMPMRMDLYAAQTGRFVQIAGWLKDGVTDAQASDQLQRVLAGLMAQTGASASAGATYPAGSTISFNRPALPAVREDVRQTLFVLLAAVVLLAVAGCVNVAALLLVRATGRLRDLGIHVALGASWGRIVRAQFLDVAMLAATGAAIGITLAYALLPVLLSMLPPYVLPLGAVVTIDGRVLIVMTIVTAIVCGVCGLLPAMFVSRNRAGLEPLLRQGTAASGHGVGTRRVWRVLIASEIAMATMLSILTGVFAHGLARLEGEPLRYAPDGVTQLGITVSSNRYPAAPQRIAFLSQAIERIRALPDVETAAVAVPSGPRSTQPTTFTFGGGGRAAAGNQRVGLRIVGADFYPTFRIPLLRGRGLTQADERAGLPVAVVNEAFTRQYGSSGSGGSGNDVIGQQVTIQGLTAPRGGAASASTPPPAFDIVGVMADVPNGRTPGVTEPEVAVLYTAAARGQNYFLVVRAAHGAPLSLVKPVQRAVWAIDPDQAFRSIWTEEEMLWASRFGWPRFRTFLLALFGAVSLGLAAAGVYGILSYVIAGEAREIGLRLALGATSGGIVRHVLGRGLRPAIVGIVIGSGLAAAGGTLVRSFTGTVSPWDPLAYAAATMVSIAVTCGACVLPARRAARIDPLTTLKGQ